MIILLDEPSDSLDSNFKTILVDLINDWKMSGKAVLLVEQNLEILNNITNNIITMTAYV